MSEDDPKVGEKDRSPGREGRPEITVIGDLAKELVESALRVLDDACGVFRKGREFGVEVGRFLGGRRGRGFTAAAVLGGTSPLTGGWGIPVLATTPTVAWVPVVLLPVAWGLLRLFVSSLRSIDAEAARGARRGQQRTDDADEEVQAAKSTAVVDRELANQRAIAAGRTEPLDECDWVGEMINISASRLESRRVDLNPALFRLSRRYQLMEIHSARALDDGLREALATAWTKVLFTASSFTDALSAALGPLGYEHDIVVFSLGAHPYILVGIAGMDIPDHARLELDHLATALSERYAYRRDDESGGQRSDATA